MMVVRIPYLDLNRGPDTLFPIFTYNNVLVENYQDGMGGVRHVVTMPAYDIPALDHAAQAVYVRLGFTVVPVRGMRVATVSKGALHCLAKVAGRRE